LPFPKETSRQSTVSWHQHWAWPEFRCRRVGCKRLRSEQNCNRLCEALSWLIKMWWWWQYNKQTKHQGIDKNVMIDSNATEINKTSRNWEPQLSLLQSKSNTAATLTCPEHWRQPG
jgi:hypothetical protein